MTDGREWQEQYEFDVEKDRLNQRNHGVSLAAAHLMFGGPIVEWPDERMDYGEERWIALGLLRERVFCCVYAMRGDRRRFISLRKANRGEEAKFYENWESR